MQGKNYIQRNSTQAGFRPFFCKTKCQITMKQNCQSCEVKWLKTSKFTYKTTACKNAKIV